MVDPSHLLKRFLPDRSDVCWRRTAKKKYSIKNCVFGKKEPKRAKKEAESKKKETKKKQRRCPSSVVQSSAERFSAQLPLASPLGPMSGLGSCTDQPRPPKIFLSVLSLSDTLSRHRVIALGLLGAVS
jgi:hypothetical protein